MHSIWIVIMMMRMRWLIITMKVILIINVWIVHIFIWKFKMSGFLCKLRMILICELFYQMYVYIRLDCIYVDVGIYILDGDQRALRILARISYALPYFICRIGPFSVYFIFYCSSFSFLIKSSTTISNCSPSQ